MQDFVLILLFASAFVVALSAEARCEGTPEGTGGLFDYDSSQPPDVEVVGADTLAGYGARVEDITFASPVAGRVTAYLVLPLEAAGSTAAGRESGRQVGQGGSAQPANGVAAPGAPAKYAGIVFLHWGQGDRSEFLWEALLYAGAGAVSILVDAPWARPKPWKQPGETFVDPESDKRMYIQNIKDLRRAVDVLLARGDVDPQRLAYVGHSFGATQGGVFAGVEKRVRTFILMAGLPSLVDRSLSGARQLDEMNETVNQYLTAEQLKTHDEVLAPLTPANFIGASSPASVLMQFGRYDSWIPKKAAEHYFAAAGEPKQIRWYETSHEFTDLAALVDRAEWLRQEVGIGPVEARLRSLTD